MFWILSLILLVIFKCFSAGKDASAFLLKDNSKNDIITIHRLDRWHRDGVVIDLLFTLVLTWATQYWITTPIQSLIIRLAIYDIAFNKWSSLDLTYIGNTSLVDKFFRSIFGEHGAIKKGIIFAILLIIWGICHAFKLI